jgi:hypothetical protein
VATDGSKNQAPGGPGPAAASRLRAEEVVERGLRLYAHGDLVGALAEWRRALEIDRTNRRGRDYVNYVEDHFEVLSEKFRSAREKRASEDAAIEMEAEDPMEDIDPYESMVLEGAADERAPAPAASQGGADPGAAEGDDEGPGPAPEAPQLLAGAAGAVGKHGGGRRPWSGRRRDPDDPWPIDESWPGSSRNDTLEMALDPACLDDLDEIGVASEADTEELDPPGTRDDEDGEADPHSLEAERAALARALSEDDIVTGEQHRLENHEPGTGEITLPAHKPRNGRSAEGSGPLDPHMAPRAGLPRDPPDAAPLDLSDFAARPTLTDEEVREEEAWADGTPVAEARGLSAIREEELREVRVTFRRPSRSNPALARDGSPPEAGRETEPDGQQEFDSDESSDQMGMSASNLVEEVKEGEDAFGRGTAEEEVDDAINLPDLDASELDQELDDDEIDDDERTAERRRMPVDDHSDGRERIPRRERAAARDRDRGFSRREPTREQEFVPTPALLGGDDMLLFGDEADEPLRLRPRVRAGREGVDGGEERATTDLAHHRPVPHSAVSIELVSSELVAELDRSIAAAKLAGDEQVRERVTWLIDRAQSENREGRYPNAVVAVDLALDENPESAVAQKLIHTHRELLVEIYGNFLGDMSAVPGLALPMSAIPIHELDHRAAFLLSRVDGVLSLEDVLDVSGMARLEALRHLSRLMLRGILEIRQ